MLCEPARTTMDDDSGVSLIELLVAVAIVAIILTTLTLSVGLGFESSTSAEARVDRSNIAEFTASYFAGDAASSTDPATSAAPSTPCSGDQVVIVRTDGSTASYGVAVVAGRSTLQRRVCDSSGVLSTTPLGSGPGTLVLSGGCSAVTAPQCALQATWSADAASSSFTLRGTRRTT